MPQDGENARRITDYWNAQLQPKGVRVLLLKKCAKTGACLVYVFRPKRLERIMTSAESRNFLAKYGYPLSDTPEGLLSRLSDRLCLEEDFPHEIGVFLDYPLEDVVGFIEHKGQNYVCGGLWKCYADPSARKKLFDTYKKCTRLLTERLDRGFPLPALTVSAQAGNGF